MDFQSAMETFAEAWVAANAGAAQVSFQEDFMRIHFFVFFQIFKSVEEMFAKLCVIKIDIHTYIEY